MSVVEWEVQDKGTAQVIQNFNALTEAQQRAVVAGSKLGGELKKTGSQAPGLKKVANEAGKIAAGLGAAVSVVGLMNAGIENMKRRMRELQALSKEAEAIGRRLDQGRGVVIANDPNLNAAQRARANAAISRVGASLGAEGAQQAGRIFADIRTKTPGASLNQQIQAFEIASKQAQLTGDLGPIADSAAANVKVQQQLAKEGRPSSGIAAQNLLLTAGSRAGIDTGQVGTALNRIINTTGASTAEKASLLGFLTAESGQSGEQAATTITALLNKTNASGNKVGAVGGSDFEKLMDIVGKRRAGQLSADDVRKVFGNEAAQSQAIASLVGKPGVFAETLALNNAAPGLQGNLQQKQFAQALADDPGLKRTIEARAAAGAAAVSLGTSGQFRDAASTAQQIFDFRKGLGLVDRFTDQDELAGVDARSRRASRRGAGGSTRFASFEQRRAIRESLGIDAGLAPRTTAAIDSAFEEGGEEAAFREAILRGFVTPSGGLSPAERRAFTSQGVTAERLNSLEGMWADGNQSKFEQLFREMIEEIKGLRNDGATTIKQQDLNP